MLTALCAHQMAKIIRNSQPAAPAKRQSGFHRRRRPWRRLEAKKTRKIAESGE